MDKERVEPESSLRETHSSVESAKPTFDDALSFIDSVKEAFHDEPAKNNEFYNLLKALPHSVDKDNGLARIVELIKGHEQYESLLYRFGFFYPPALRYISPKDTFQDQNKKYDQFHEIMKDSKSQRVDATGLLTRLIELFKDHHELIMALNNFLKIKPEPEDEQPSQKKVTDIEEVISFVNKTKTRFQGDDHVCKTFIQISNTYRNKRMSITQVYDEVSILFRDHRDLLMEFNHFLPDSIQKKLVDFKEILRFIYMIEMRFQDDADGVCKSFVDILGSYRYGSKSTIEFSQETAFLLRDHADLLEEFYHMLY